jgi:hypothetical protein
VVGSVIEVQILDDDLFFHGAIPFQSLSLAPAV